MAHEGTLRGAFLQGADLSGASLRDANLTGAGFEADHIVAALVYRSPIPHRAIESTRDPLMQRSASKWLAEGTPSRQCRPTRPRPRSRGRVVSAQSTRPQYVRDLYARCTRKVRSMR
ncbi:pentapeptide repeat-containing protein [Streptomyces flaveolus]|uniref:pentapeptide repeat-containing protein n=1 Tax=Streptomyces flaveolus TaxID=67297 RepID=UPI00381E4995